jgi:hypothetical protein
VGTIQARVAEINCLLLSAGKSLARHASQDRSFRVGECADKIDATLIALLGFAKPRSNQWAATVLQAAGQMQALRKWRLGNHRLRPWSASRHFRQFSGLCLVQWKYTDYFNESEE